MRGIVLKTTLVAAVLATTLAIAQTTAPTHPAAAQPGSTTQNSASVQNANAPAARPDDLANRNPADISLEKQINGLFAHKAEFQNVKISVNDGVVTLDGSVPTKIERRQAKALARSVIGVKKVQEHLSLSGGGVSGPGTVANTPVTAQNQPNAIGGNAGTARQGAGSDAPSVSAPSSEPGGGTTGTILSTAPPSSNIGSGGSTIPQPSASATAALNSPQRQTSTFGLTTIDTAGLASKINAALKNDPALANKNVMVNIGDQGVEVTGSVDTGKEKLTAMRIAQSYAGNFKVVDRLTLAGHPPSGNGQQNASQTTQGNGGSTPPPNVAGNTVLPAGTAQNTPTRDPKNAGDKSSNPRQ